MHEATDVLQNFNVKSVAVNHQYGEKRQASKTHRLQLHNACSVENLCLSLVIFQRATAPAASLTLEEAAVSLGAI